MIWILFSDDGEIMGVFDDEKFANKVCEEYNQMATAKSFYIEFYEIERDSNVR